MYTETNIRMTAVFSWKLKTQCNFKLLKTKICQCRSACPEELNFKNESELPSCF